jgi:predicted acylesterase/phospholipase RssA
MLARIAAERAKGRVLLIGTTNLNAQRPVFWDMGKIAQIGTPEALALFRKVLLASTAIPGLFPPVEIAVVADGKIYHEMHVDGGTTREVFLSPASQSFRHLHMRLGRPIKRRLWVIRNGKIGPEYAYVEATAMAIAARSLSTVTKNQGIGDLIRMYIQAHSEGIDYNLLSIPENFTHPRQKPFDQAYMRALFERGVAIGSSTAPWSKAPPDVPAIALR